MMAFGSDLDDSGALPPRVRQPEREEEEVDRFEEVVREIEERKQFLEDMGALGQDKPHRSRIMTEISQVCNYQLSNHGDHYLVSLSLLAENT